MEIQKPSNLFHITVGATPSTSKGVSLERELQLLKTALLYGDKVKLCSLSSSFLITLIHFDKVSDEELMRMGMVINPQFEQTVQIYENLKRKKNRSKQELLAVLKGQKVLKAAKENGQRIFEAQAKQAGLQHLAKVFDAGLIEIQMFDGHDTEALAKQYFEVVSQAVLSGNTYPLFDNTTGNLVSIAVKDGKIQPSNIAINRAKQVSLSADLLNRLPRFDSVPFDEVLDIRKELDKPLQRFRSAIIKFSRDIESASWDKDFLIEADQIFIEHVQPAILDIEEACRANKFLSSLLPNLVDKPLLVATSALGIVLAGASQSPEIIAAGFALGGVAVGLRTVQEWQKKNQEIKRNHLYFYYKASKLTTN
jgi:hypothetical protein